MGLSWKTVPLEPIKDRIIFLSVTHKDNITLCISLQKGIV